MVALFHLVISVAALHQVEVGHDHQPQAVIELMIMFQMLGLRTLDLHLLLGRCHQTKHLHQHCVLEVRKIGLIAHSFQGLLSL